MNIYIKCLYKNNRKHLHHKFTTKFTTNLQKNVTSVLIGPDSKLGSFRESQLKQNLS